MPSEEKMKLIDKRLNNRDYFLTVTYASQKIEITATVLTSENKLKQIENCLNSASRTISCIKQSYNNECAQIKPEPVK